MDYLREKEERIPKIEYGSKLKPFFSPLFELDGFVYVTQITSKKERHKTMKNSLDFIKIYYENGNLIGAVNLNYMFPVPKNLIIEITGSNIEKYRSFDSEIDKSKYLNLLKHEMKEILKNSIEEKAKKIYEIKQTKPQHVVSKRCLDFKKLEIEAKNYKEV